MLCDEWNQEVHKAFDNRHFQSSLVSQRRAAFGVPAMFFVDQGDGFRGSPPPGQVTWQPAADVYRCAGGWLIKVELAGVRLEDVKIDVDARGIVVSGSRRDIRQFESQETYLMEIYYSRFERIVPIPEPIDNLKTRAEYRDGMLYVRLTAKQ
jgi:HSP20 family protein